MSGKTDNPFRQWMPLEQPRLGTRVVYATDDFFAPKERLIAPNDPVYVADRYDDHGKWMDGWESRRRRDGGYDYCIVRLGAPAVIRGVDVDTSYFTGNYPPAASVDACRSEEDVPGEDTEWRELLARFELGGDAHHFHHVDDDRAVTHLRLNIYPDGGVARLRVYGQIHPDPLTVASGNAIDLFACEHGGRALACSDEHFGSMHNLNISGRGVNMGDGWETARRRAPGNDWVVVALGRPGTIDCIEIDTAHFKGNYPDRASVRAALIEGPFDAVGASAEWPVLLPETKLGPDAVHRFAEQLNDIGVVSHARLDIYPDGGVSRLRLFGAVSAEGDDE